MIQRFLLLAVILTPWLAQAATGLSNPTLTNFNQGDFTIDPNGSPTNVVRVNLGFNRPPGNDLPGDLLTFMGGTNFWTNRAGLYYPTVTNASTIVFGQSAEALFAPSANDGIVSVHDASAGDSLFNSLIIAAYDHPLQQDFSYLTVVPGAGASVSGTMQLLSATNWQNPAAPISKFEVGLQPLYGMASLQLINNGVREFAVSNQVTTVMGLQFVPLDAAPLVLGPNAINVQSNSYVRLVGPTTDPSVTEVNLTTALHDGTALILQNDGAPNGFTLFNGSALTDDPTKWVTLPGGTWASTNTGDGMLLVYGPQGWREVGRFNSNTNVVTGDALWELTGGHMRTVPFTLDDWQFRYGDVPQLTVSSNAGIAIGANTLTWWGGPITDGTTLVNYRNTTLGDPNLAGMDLMASSSPTDADYGSLHIAIGTNLTQLTLTSATNTADTALWNLAANRFLGQFSLNGSYGGTNFVDFQPSIVDAPNAIAYTLRTVNPITDASARLLVLGNETTNQLSFGPDARIWFGAGGTNALYRDPGLGRDLVWSNSYSYPAIKVRGTGGSPAIFGLASGTYGDFAQLAGPKGVSIGWDTGLIGFGSTNILPSGQFNLGSIAQPFWNLQLDGTNFIYGYNALNGNDYTRMAIYVTGTNGVIKLSSQSAGTAGVARPFEIDRNLGATLAVGDTSVVDMFQASATNALAGALTFLSATNGMDLIEFTHVRYIFNNTGSDQTITLPALWANTMGASIVCTNQKKLRLYVTSVGPTDTAANQTNVWSSVQYAP